MNSILNFNFRKRILLPVPAAGPEASSTMIVCHCKAVSDRTIREAVQRGARTMRQCALASNAGRGCGGCLPVVREIVEREADGAAAVPPDACAAAS
jgi:bacterioferritin-associated ferredoxin